MCRTSSSQLRISLEMSTFLHPRMMATYFYFTCTVFLQYRHNSESTILQAKETMKMPAIMGKCLSKLQEHTTNLEILALLPERANVLFHKSDCFSKSYTQTYTNISKTNTAFLNVTWLCWLGYTESSHLDHPQSQR